MNRQSGISTAGIALVVVVLAAAGGGFFGWQQHQELGRTKSELANTRGALDKASAEARTAKADAASARKELDDQKANFEQMRVERDAAKAFLDTERAHSARLQQDLTLAREQIAYMGRRSPAAAQVAPPMALQPNIIRVVPAQQRPRAVGVGVPAAAPAQGQSPQ